ncbi:MAG: hypothetical protein AAF798_17855 [Bacteroidota bacterium]
MFTTSVPTLLSIAFLLAFTVPVGMVANLVRKGASVRAFYFTLLFYSIYLSAAAVASIAGVFDVVSLPPRIVVVTALPLLLFYLLFISNTAFYKDLLQRTPLTDLVRVHIFRLVGVFFILLLSFQQLPATFAFIAGVGDMFTALSSIWVAQQLQQGKSYAKNLTLAWNTFGLLDIIATSSMAIYYTKLNIDTGSLGVDILGQFPFCFIPAFAPATIIFLHLSVYRKVYKTS